MTRGLPPFLVAGLFVLHQDVWWWRDARPLVFGVLPIGLFYHAAYTVAVAVALGLLIHLAWPAHLDAAPSADE